MVEVDLPEGEGVPAAVRGFGACLASVLEVPSADLPSPASELNAAVHRWRGWLAGRGVGLVEVAEPGRFSWPGYWIAVVGERAEAGDEAAVVMFGTPAGVVLSPQGQALLGAPASELPVRRGYVVSALDPAFDARSGSPPALRGTVEAIAITPEATLPMRQVESARALAGRGLEGDRYAAKVGTFTPKSESEGRGYDLTLIEAEVLDALTLADGGRLAYVDARRNIVTRGIDLNALVGRRFRVGEAECVGRRLCEPCAHLERLTARGVLRALIHRGGLRADILADGQVSTGARIETID